VSEYGWSVSRLYIPHAVRVRVAFLLLSASWILPADLELRSFARSITARLRHKMNAECFCAIYGASRSGLSVSKGLTRK
jgi:hypothetical protein